jgi:hypothetical protein
MRKILLLIFLSGCKVTDFQMHNEKGCWYEKGNLICGEAVLYSTKEQTYSMKTDGWVMKIEADKIQWQNAAR